MEGKTCFQKSFTSPNHQHTLHHTTPHSLRVLYGNEIRCGLQLGKKILTGKKILNDKNMHVWKNDKIHEL